MNLLRRCPSSMSETQESEPCVIFTARCYAYCIAYAVVRCPSARPSHANGYNLRNGYNLHISLNLFHHRPGSPTTLVFPYQTVWQYSDGDPPNGDVERKVVFFRDFRSISRFISEMIQDRAIVTGRRIGNRTRAFAWYRF